MLGDPLKLDRVFVVAGSRRSLPRRRIPLLVLYRQVNFGLGNGWQNPNSKSVLQMANQKELERLHAHDKREIKPLRKELQRKGGDMSWFGRQD